VLEVTASLGGRPVVVSEVHDVGRINVEEAEIQRALAGLAGGRGWDAA
jgi:hypothetical protein